MAHQNPLFDLGPQSMLRIIRSARSRLSRETSAQENTSMQSSMQQQGDKAVRRTSTGRASFGGMGRTRLSRSKSSLEQAGASENAAAEKPQQHSSSGGSVLGDVTNLSVMPSGGLVMEDTKLTLKAQCDRLQTGSSAVTSNSELHESDRRLAKDPQHAVEYIPDILKVLEREQVSHSASAGYMEKQVHVNAKMRGILVDWLVSVQQKYKMKAETLFLAVTFLDRYLEKKHTTPRRYLQLVGITALMVAAKYEEMYPPQIADFVYVTDKAYSREEILKMEVTMLSALDFQVCTPTAMQFLERYQSVNGCKEAHRFLAQYLLEMALPDYSMLKYSASLRAAASVFLSNKLLRQHPSWPSSMAKASNYVESNLKECAKEMCALLEHAESNSLQAVRRKYSQPKYHAVAKLNFTASSQTHSQAVEPNRSSTSRPSSSGDRRRSLSNNDPSAATRCSVNSPGAPLTTEI